jgi:hypothetical protein
MVEVDPTVAEDFTEVVASTVAAVIAARAASEAEWDLAAAAGFVAARSAEVRAFAEVRSAVDFVVAIAFAAAFVATASAAAGAGADEVGVGEDGAGVGTGASAGAGRIGTHIRTDITTRGGRRAITRPAMIPTTILTIPTTTRHRHTQIGLTRIDIGTAGTRIRHRRELQ